jgi:tetratricopeptide (TPR) repeat protein
MRRPVAALLTLVTLTVLSVPAVTGAQSVVEQARTLVARPHEDPRRIDRARDLLEDAIRRERPVEALVELSRVWYVYGDVRAAHDDDKLAAYDRGREVGRLAVELAPRDWQAHLWYAINTGRWAQTKGVMRALFLLPTVREEVDTILALNPRAAAGHALAGNVFSEVPVLFGGDRARAEEHYRKGLAIDPAYTVIRVDLARLLIANGRYADARKELQRVLGERAPASVADWTVKDVPRARTLLESIQGK